MVTKQEREAWELGLKFIRALDDFNHSPIDQEIFNTLNENDLEIAVENTVALIEKKKREIVKLEETL